jgi:hypothetical protein
MFGGGEPGPESRPGRVSTSLFRDFILKRHAFRVMLSEPVLGSLFVSEDLQVVNIADLFGGANIDPDWYENASLTRSKASCCRILTLIQSFDRPPR